MRQAWGHTPALSSRDRRWLGFNTHAVSSCHRAVRPQLTPGVQPGASRLSILVDTEGKRGLAGSASRPFALRRWYISCLLLCNKLPQNIEASLTTFSHLMASVGQAFSVSLEDWPCSGCLGRWPSRVGQAAPSEGQTGPGTRWRAHMAGKQASAPRTTWTSHQAGEVSSLAAAGIPRNKRSEGGSKGQATIW